MKAFLEVDGAAFRHRDPLYLEPPLPRKVYSALGIFELLVRRDLAGGRDGLLLHLAFLAELRLALGVYPERWRVVQEADRVDAGGLEPDALWRRGEGVWAVEVDLGYYSRKRVEGKLLHYREAYARQVWGVLGEARRRFLSQRARDLGVEVEVVLLHPPG